MVDTETRPLKDFLGPFPKINSRILIKNKRTIRFNFRLLIFLGRLVSILRVKTKGHSHIPHKYKTEFYTSRKACCDFKV